MLGVRAKSSCIHFKNVSYSVYLQMEQVYQHFYSMLLGRREGVCKKSTLCMFVKMLKTMDGPLLFNSLILSPDIVGF